METVQIPREEYISLKEEIDLLKDSILLEKMNKLIDLMFERKYGLYMGDFTGDLLEANINNIKEWETDGTPWDEL